MDHIVRLAWARGGVRALKRAGMTAGLTALGLAMLLPGALGAASPFMPGAMDAHGRYVVFTTGERLLPLDRSGTEDVYRYDQNTGRALLVSSDYTHTRSGNARSYTPMINADGTVVAYTSEANNLVFNDANETTDIFVLDLKTGITCLISMNASGTRSGNGRSSTGYLSADGRYVAFESEANDLTGLPDGNGEAKDVFVHDRTAGVTWLASANRDRVASGNAVSRVRGISANGRFVLFESLASDLTSNDTNHIRDIFVYDLAIRVTALVSVNQSGTAGGNEDSFDPVIDANGSKVAFASVATDLAPGDTNRMIDIFVRDLSTAVTELVSGNVSGTASGNGNSYAPKISQDGTVIAFTSEAKDLTQADANGLADVFVHSLATRTTTLASLNRFGTASGNGRSDGVALSANGKVLAFVSTADDLTTNAVDNLPNLFVRRLDPLPAPLPAGFGGRTVLASVTRSGVGSGNDPAYFHDPHLSGDGSLMAFSSLATNLAAENILDSNVLFLYQLTRGTPVLRFERKGSGLQLSYPADGLWTLECSPNLDSWMPLSSMPHVTYTIQTIGTKTVVLVEMDRELPGTLSFRLYQP